MRIVPISIIVPTFNRPLRLENLIKRLSCQTVYPSELIIIDNSTFGDAKNVLDRLSGETHFILRYLRQKRKGPTYGMNMGINRAKCPILAFLDDDCLPDFEWLEQVYEVLKHNRFNIVKGSNSNGYPKNIVACAYHFFVESVINSGIYHFGQNKYCLYLDTKNFAARKILFDRIGLFDNRFSKYSAMYDLDLSERIRRKRMRILYCPRMKATHYGRSGLSNFLLRCFEMGMARCTFYAIWHISKSEGLKGLKSIYNNRITVNIKKYRYKVNRKMIIGFTVNKTGIWIIGFRFVNYLGSVFSFLGYQLESLRLFMRKAIHGPGHL